MLKKKLAAIIICAVFMVVQVAVLPVYAAEVVETTKTVSEKGLDFSENPASTQGDGYSWDQSKKTLTLSGIDLDVKSGPAISLCDGATLILEEGTTNIINSQTNEGIIAGTLTVKGKGALEVTSQGNGIVFGDHLLIEENCSVTLNTQEDGIYSLSAQDVLIKDKVNISIKAKNNGIKTPPFATVDITGNPTVNIDVGIDGIVCGDIFTFTGGNLTILAGTNGIYSDCETVIKNAAGLSITSKLNGISSATDVIIDSTPITMNTLGACISAWNDLTITNVRNSTLNSNDMGIALVGNLISITDSDFAIEGAKGMDSFSGQIDLERSNIQISSREAMDAGVVNLKDASTLTLSPQTKLTIDETNQWNIDTTSSFENNGMIENNGQIEVNGVFTNNGVYTHGNTAQLNGAGTFFKGENARVILSGTVSEELRSKLEQIGALFLIRNEPLDYTGTAYPEDGDGYSWDEETKTLFLSGAVISTSSTDDTLPAIKLPEGAKIYVAPGTVSSIENNNAAGKAIRSEGDLLIYGSGSLNLHSKEIAVDVGSKLTICGPYISSSSAAGITAMDIDIQYARVGIVATEGPSIMVINSLNVADSAFGLYSLKDTVLRIPVSSSTVNWKDHVSIDSLPQNIQPSIIEEVTRTGYHIGLVDETNTPVQSLTIDTYKQGHVVQFNSQTETDIPFAKVEHGTTIQQPSVSKENYQLMGWYQNPFNNIYYDFNTPVTDDLILNAKWQPIVVNPDDPQPEIPEGEGEKQPEENTPLSPNTGDQTIYTWMIVLFSIGFVTMITVFIIRIKKVNQ